MKISHEKIVEITIVLAPDNLVSLTRGDSFSGVLDIGNFGQDYKDQEVKFRFVLFLESNGGLT